MAEYSDLYYTVTDGLTLYARDYPGPRKDAPVVLCMHGLTRNSRDFRWLAPELAKSHRVLVAEQRGRGHSEYDNQIARYQPQVYMGDMLELLSQQGIAQCAVVGTSLGGLMAMGMNAARPGIFSHVVLNDIGPVLASAGLERIKQYVGSASEFADWEGAVDYARTVNAVAFPKYGPVEWRQFAENLCTERGGKVVLDYDLNISKPIKGEDSAALPPDMWALFDALADTPLLLVRGAISDLLDVDCVEEMQRRHPGMAYLEVPDVGHAPMLNEPGVSQRIVEFINS